MENRKDVVQLLLKHKANQNLRIKNGKKPSQLGNFFSLINLSQVFYYFFFLAKSSHKIEIFKIFVQNCIDRSLTSTDCN